ncbi:MAG TPA: 50S ribosomal protein L5 [Planctomycetota bacterium]|nr:50S ribosomal protein L5 [Planctomycetota bacterium]HUW30629.1 50S ribosomal protein L5 [Planctomycetota bacterium]
MARLKEKYEQEIAPKLKERFHITNPMAVPRLRKIVVNMGIGKALENKQRLETAVVDLTAIAGQKPVITKAKKSIAGFKLRAGNPIGVKVTVRRDRMYEFVDRLVNIALPRIRDFRGVSPDSFDGHGNYTIGISEQSVFPEVNVDKMEFVQGMDITFVISGNSNEQSRELLREFGMPFER